MSHATTARDNGLLQITRSNDTSAHVLVEVCRSLGVTSASVTRLDEMGLRVVWSIVLVHELNKKETDRKGKEPGKCLTLFLMDYSSLGLSKPSSS